MLAPGSAAELAWDTAPAAVHIREYPNTAMDRYAPIASRSYR
jgi:hypothetical protein